MELSIWARMCVSHSHAIFQGQQHRNSWHRKKTAHSTKCPSPRVECTSLWSGCGTEVEAEEGPPREILHEPPEFQRWLDHWRLQWGELWLVNFHVKAVCQDDWEGLVMTQAEEQWHGNMPTTQWSDGDSKRTQRACCLNNKLYIDLGREIKLLRKFQSVLVVSNGA